MKSLGAVACGHPETAKAAETILREGGNAFDAIIAAFLTSCVVEPVLASLGGGGFLLAHTDDGHRDIVYDFFAQTPLVPLAKDELDFYPIHADFGTTTQEFHIGLASIATPGAIKGVFRIHEDLGSMPMKELVQPAIEVARHGVEMSQFQAYILNIIAPILTASRKSATCDCLNSSPGVISDPGCVLLWYWRFDSVVAVSIGAIILSIYA